MKIRKAFSQKDFESVWRLTCDVYLAEGYSNMAANGMLRHYPHLDLIPETSVLMAEDKYGNLLGSNSYTLDGPNGLPMDDDFKDIVDQIRVECLLTEKPLAASWRIVTVPGCRNLLPVVMGLISATLAGGAKLGFDGVVLYVFNPKHESFYRRMLGLRTVAGPRVGHSVNGAPAVLMRGEMKEMAAKWAAVSVRRQSARSAPLVVGV